MNRSATLLPVVARLAERLGAQRDSGTTVTLSQVGRMRQSANARWQGFTANQTITVDRCGFDWRARSGPVCMVSIQDGLIDGVGRLKVRALGIIPIATLAPSDALTRGEMIRYLAEIAWGPDAILQNADLRWSEEGPDRLVVSAGSGGAQAEVTLTLNAEGRIAEAFSPDRGALTNGVSVPTPWRGAFSDYRLHDGRWLPFAGEVAWGSGNGAWTYWQGRLVGWSQG
ncbi:DUF6544 family protein [Brevundimonas sp.]